MSSTTLGQRRSRLTTICLYRCPALALRTCDKLLNTIMFRKVPALTYSSHSTTIPISFVVATRRLYQYKSKLIPKRDEGNTAPPSLTNKKKTTTKKDFLRQFGLLLFRLRFVDCNSLTTTHDRNITHSIPDTQYRHDSTISIHTLFNSQFWFYSRADIPHGTGRLFASFLATGGYLVFRLYSLLLIFSFSNLIFWCLFPLASLTDIYSYPCNWCLRDSIYAVMRMPYRAMRRRDLRVYVFCMPMPAFGKGFGGWCWFGLKGNGVWGWDENHVSIFAAGLDC
jgi:hypothetical protein